MMTHLLGGFLISGDEQQCVDEQAVGTDGQGGGGGAVGAVQGQVGQAGSGGDAGLGQEEEEPPEAQVLRAQKQKHARGG